jgi:4-alpha-glucanotransferase
LQDVMGVGSEGRMNLPGTSSGNWRWRFRSADLFPGTAKRLKEMAGTYDR